MIFDAVIRGGQLVDGTGAAPWRADVGVADGKVAAIGRLGDAEAGTVVDATDRLVLPGFVDAHSHADRAVLEGDVQLALLRQGVTTVVTGQDGVSFAPGSAATTAWAGEYFAGINGQPDAQWSRGLSLAEYRTSLDRRTRINTAHLLPHGTLRYEAAGLSPTLSDDQRANVLRLAADGLADGACGLSTGLHYVPGLHGDVDEFSALSELLAAAGRPYVSHMRGYEAESWLGMDEVRQIAERSGAAVHVSHLHGPANLLTSLVDDARAAGLDVTFDSYPYMRGFSLLSVPLLPPELLGLPTHQLVDKLADADVARELGETWSAAKPSVFDRITIANAPHDEFRQYEGLSATAAAELANKDASAFVIDIMRATNAAVTAVFQQPPTNTEADMRALLRHEAHMGGSDGIFVGGHPHPRAYGAFARFLARHVVELGDWTWAEAAVHLASHPARRYGLLRRGVLRPGQSADLVIVDPRHVRDTATYDSPRRLADGVGDVWVNGEQVLRDGQLTDVLAGRALSWGEW